MKTLAQLALARLASMLLALLAGLAMAATATVPEALAPWADWVLRDRPDHGCYRLAADPERRHCLWPGTLDIELTATGASFRQRWESQAPEQWLALPGDAEHWPREVLLDGTAAAVVAGVGGPGLWIGPGAHEVSGHLRWDSPPVALAIPATTALVALRRDGAPVAAVLDAEHRLWLQPRQEADAAASLQVEVFRRIDDGVPVRLYTELRLTVAGAAREVTLGRALPQGAAVIDLQSPLPARLEDDGRLRVQLRPGRWQLLLDGRYQERPERFVAEPLDDHWPAQELWAFRAAPEVRGIRLEGAPSIDPARLDLPAALADLPVYLVTPEQPLLATEEYRGDANPAADRLRLERSLWLDFAGGGATLSDRIGGQLNRDRRLEAGPELALGRVAVNGVPQVISRLPDAPGVGVEVRERELNLEAVGRIDSASGPGTLGWMSEFERADIALQLPPGWQLWHARGPDIVDSSWLTRWDLWDLFLCLLIASATLRLLGWRWGAIAALTLALSYHERNAPVAGWVAMVIAIPLLAALPTGRLRAAVRTGALAALVLLTLNVLGFAVQQVRVALYPQLELPGAIPAPYVDTAVRSAPATAEMAQSLGYALDKAAPVVESRPRYTPDDNTQTGPGQPGWRWQQARLAWSGPVRADETLELWLSPPWLTRSLKLAQVLLVGLLLFGLARALWRHRTGDPTSSGRGGAAAALLAPLTLLALSGVAPPAAAREFPPPELLQELRTELLRPPSCAPQCQSLLDAQLELDAAGVFALRLRAGASAPVAIPLPPPEGWQVRALLRDGVAAPLADLDAIPWAGLNPGVRELVLQGMVQGDSAAFRFPLPPAALRVAAPGWRLEGLDGERLRGDTLRLHREVASGDERLLADPAPPFVLIERELALDLDWRLTTSVIRIAPRGGAINLAVPLLPGEAVIGEHRRSADGQLLVTLHADQQELHWESLLEPVPELTLSAPRSPQWVERWRVASSPRWHLATTGVPAIQSPQAGHAEWWPWPGEQVTLSAQRPEPAPGPTVTVERARLDQRSGARGAELEVELELRSSLGGDYRLRAPVGAALQRVELDGAPQTRPEQDGEVVLPLHPGVQRARIAWQLGADGGFWTTTAPLALPTPATNIELGLQLPADRWPLWVRGPDLGPALLYWGVLGVVVAVAIALGLAVRRWRLSIPLSIGQWLLLGIGMSTINTAGSLAVVAWFFALEARRRKLPERPLTHNLIQLALIVLTLIAVASLAYTIPQSLLAAPDMQVTGNGSSHLDYRWYQDRTQTGLPQGAVFSLPLWSYRLAMLAWSLWLAFALLGWARWGWDCLTQGGLWRRGAARTTGEPPAAGS
ncbi:MAG: hypothetical protein IT469_05425 [Pseudomonadales bacterium]|nr:hypothetical protein [Pseudomonadales bacterium]